MKKNIITITNIVSTIPLFLYLPILIAGSMSFDAPDSGRRVLPWVMFLFSTLYPVFIIVFIIVSRKKKSLLLASVGLIPLLFLIFVFHLPIELARKDEYYTLNRDFICNSNSFLSVEKNNNFGAVNLLEKKNFYTYKMETIADIDGGDINIFSDNPKETRNLLSNCKNNEGKSLLDFYALVSE